jgi:hypothetical protein
MAATCVNVWSAVQVGNGEAGQSPALVRSRRWRTDCSLRVGMPLSTRNGIPIRRELRRGSGLVRGAWMTGSLGFVARENWSSPQ